MPGRELTDNNNQKVNRRLAGLPLK